MPDPNELLALADTWHGDIDPGMTGRLINDLAAALRAEREAREAAEEDADEIRKLLAHWVHLIRNSPDRIKRLLASIEEPMPHDSFGPGVTREEDGS